MRVKKNMEMPSNSSLTHHLTHELKYALLPEAAKLFRYYGVYTLLHA